MQQERILEQLGTTIKQGAAKLYCKRGRWYLALSVTVPAAPCAGERVAGVDMGLRYLAVVHCEGETLFFKGNRAAYVRRRFNALRRRMGKAKAMDAIRRLKDKEARWMWDQDHMEKLECIRRRKTRKHDFGRSLHSWSFYRLQQFIACQKCGYEAHADAVGAWNVSFAISGLVEAA